LGANTDEMALTGVVADSGREIKPVDESEQLI
jgi:hypothetical protein